MSSYAPLYEWDYEPPSPYGSVFRVEKRVSGWRLKRALKLLGRNVKNCESCGTKRGSRIKITIHQKDGNSRNNRPANLVVLCDGRHRKIEKFNRRKPMTQELRCT